MSRSDVPDQAKETGRAIDSDAADPISESQWNERRDVLARRLAEQRAKAPQAQASQGSSRGMQGAAQGLKIASEFVAGVLVGAAIGYLIDRLAGTAPFGLIIFLLFGFAAGVLNVIRSISGKPSPGDPGSL